MKLCSIVTSGKFNVYVICIRKQDSRSKNNENNKNIFRNDENNKKCIQKSGFFNKEEAPRFEYLTKYY